MALSKEEHREICEKLSVGWQADKFRRQMEIAQIGKPRTADKVLGWLLMISIATLIVLLVKYLNHA